MRTQFTEPVLELIFGKPSFDLFIDDRALFFKKNWPKVLDRYL